MAEGLGRVGTIEAQGERYEGLTVFFVSLLASAGGAVLGPDGLSVSLEPEPTRRALAVMRRLANSPAADPALSTAREDQARLAFETGESSFMLNYTFVWPSAWSNAPQVAQHMGWARWPAVIEGLPSRVTLGGINLGIGAHSRYPRLAFAAAACIASEPNQRLAATRGGMPPTLRRCMTMRRCVRPFPSPTCCARPWEMLYNDPGHPYMPTFLWRSAIPCIRCGTSIPNGTSSACARRWNGHYARRDCCEPTTERRTATRLVTVQHRRCS